jgi:hypothetical protein
MDEQPTGSEETPAEQVLVVRASVLLGPLVELLEEPIDPLRPRRAPEDARGPLTPSVRVEHARRGGRHGSKERREREQRSIVPGQVPTMSCNQTRSSGERNLPCTSETAPPPSP